MNVSNQTEFDAAIASGSAEITITAGGTYDIRAGAPKLAPRSVPAAPDWDGGNRECGGGLHFSPHPRMTSEFHSEAKHFLACPVALADMAVHPDGQYPQKCKAAKCCAPVYEVDIDGRPIPVDAPVRSGR